MMLDALDDADRRGLATIPRFAAKLEQRGDCLVWMGARDPLGYGTAAYQGKIRKVHRLAWKLANGAIGDGLCVCHRCDNPSCVRLAHLFLGTHADNMRDMASKGRESKVITSAQTHFKSGHAPRCEDGSGAKLTNAQALDILRRRRNGEKIHSLAAEFGLHVDTVSRLIRGKNWTHLEGRAVLAAEVES